MNRAYYWANESQKRFLVLKGGAGSGKSVFCAQKLLDRCKRETDDGKFAHRFLVIRKVANTRKKSVYKLIKAEIQRQGLSKEWKWYDGELWFKHLPSGAEIITSGLDDPEKIKSIADITGIWVEEATELLLPDFSQLNLRLRGNYPYYKQIILSFNPINKSHWIAEQFDQPKSKGRGAYSDGARLDMFLTTYRHNQFIDAEYKEELEALVDVDENLYRIYVLGEWGIEDPNKLFAKDFKLDKHVSEKAVYDPLLGRVWAAFDFNVVNTCILFQYDQQSIRAFKEYRYDAGDLQDLAYEVQTDLRNMKAAALGVLPSEVTPDYIVINGDASGGNKSGLTADRSTAYEQLARFFGDVTGKLLHWDHFNVPHANPGHGSSRLVTNMVLKNERHFYIHPSLKFLIRDLENVKFEKGEIDKSDESLTHALDAFRYFVWAELNDRLKNYGISPIADKLGLPWAQQNDLDDAQDELDAREDRYV
jgi:PBSX family phage terminase large subunit